MNRASKAAKKTLRKTKPSAKLETLKKQSGVKRKTKKGTSSSQNRTSQKSGAHSSKKKATASDRPSSSRSSPKKLSSPLSFTANVGLLSYLPGMHYLEIPKAIVEKLGGKFNVRLLCSIQGVPPFQCGIVALGEGKGYISFSKKRMELAGAVKGSKLKITLAPDKSAYGMPMPDELKEVLGFDDEGTERFKALTPGRQRYIIGHVAAVKDSEKRIERALRMIENLKKLPRGKEEFRAILGLPPRESPDRED